MKNLIINNSATIKQSLYRLEKNIQKCLLVVNEKKVFIGTLTDGDIRRAIIFGSNVDSKIDKYVRKKAYSMTSEYYSKINSRDLKRFIEKLSKSRIDVVPILDNKKRIIDFIDTQQHQDLSNDPDNFFDKIPLVIMAGGKGTRLKPFTDIFPKPLVPINNLPTVEHIINYFKESGIKKIYLTLNYKKKLIKSYFEDNKIHKLKYVEEKKILGTAGSLSLFKKKINSNFFVCNCDTIVKINLKKFYEYHTKGKFDITLAAATKKHGFPYGSCQLDRQGKLKKIIEKPYTNHLVNIGLYIIKPKIINMVPNNKTTNMDELLTNDKKANKKIGVFPVDDNSWIDVGEWSEYNKLIFDSKK